MTPRPTRDHRLYRDNGRIARARPAATRLAFLKPALHDALDRLKVPLIASQSILSQVVDEQSMGFMCLSVQGRIIEVNQRMHALVMRYLNATRTIGERGALSRFAERALLETTGGRAWPIWHEDGQTMVEISCHRLAKEAHIIDEDMFLVIMKEISLTPPAPISAPIVMLTSRQKEIARLLVASGLSYKEIADKLGISVATMSKHAENIYRAAGVHSRAELGIKLR